MPNLINGGTYTTEGASLLLDILNGGSLAPDTFSFVFYLSGWTPSPSSVYANFLANVANFDGYASPLVTFAGPYIGDTGEPVLVGNNTVVPCTGNTTTALVAGVVLVANYAGSPATHKSIRFWNFNVPITVNAAGQMVGAKAIVGEGPGLSSLLVE